MKNDEVEPGRTLGTGAARRRWPSWVGGAFPSVMAFLLPVLLVAALFLFQSPMNAAGDASTNEASVGSSYDSKPNGLSGGIDDTDRSQPDHSENTDDDGLDSSTSEHDVDKSTTGSPTVTAELGKIVGTAAPCAGYKECQSLLDNGKGLVKFYRWGREGLTLSAKTGTSLASEIAGMDTGDSTEYGEVEEVETLKSSRSDYPRDWYEKCAVVLHTDVDGKPRVVCIGGSALDDSLTEDIPDAK